MIVNDLIRQFPRLFWDSAPVIYALERHPIYAARIAPVLTAMDAGIGTAVLSPVTVAECMIAPLRLGDIALADKYQQFFSFNANRLFFAVDQSTASLAADIRARYHRSLTDAFQVAVALEATCDALLTNDTSFRRVTEIPVILIDELEL